MAFSDLRLQGGMQLIFSSSVGVFSNSSLEGWKGVL